MVREKIRFQLRGLSFRHLQFLLQCKAVYLYCQQRSLANLFVWRTFG